MCRNSHIFALIVYFLSATNGLSRTPKFTEHFKDNSNCTKYFTRKNGQILHTSCPSDSTFVSECNSCSGPPARCLPDCFGSKENPLLQWSEWSDQSSPCSGLQKCRTRKLLFCENYHVVQAEVWNSNDRVLEIRKPLTPKIKCQPSQSMLIII